MSWQRLDSEGRELVAVTTRAKPRLRRVLGELRPIPQRGEPRRHGSSTGARTEGRAGWAGGEDGARRGAGRLV